MGISFLNGDSGAEIQALGSSSIVAVGTPLETGFVDVSEHDSIVVAVKTDQDGTLQLIFSPDGVNEDSTLTRYYRTGQIEPPHRFTVTRRYVKVKFTNSSGIAQSYFRLQTLVGPKQPLNIPIDANMAQDYDAVAVRPTKFNDEVALGRRQGWQTWNKFGYNSDIDGASETIWTVGGTLSLLSSGETLSIVSTSTADDDGGTGANSIIVYGVDENWDLQTEVVTLNGTTPVVTTGSWLGVNRMAIYLAGSGKNNAGTITATASTAATIQARIEIGAGTTEHSFFFVPRNYQFLATYLRWNVNKISGGGSPRVALQMQVFSAVSNAYYDVYEETIDTAVDNIFELIPPEPFVVGEKSVLIASASTNTANTIVACRFSGKLVRDVDA